GEVVGSVNTSSAVRGFVWSRTAGLRLLSPLPGDSGSEGFGINARGETAGVSSGPRGVNAVRWTSSGVPQALATVAGTRWSRARAVNGHGEVVGSSGSFLGARAFRWTAAAGLQDLNDLVPISDFVLLDVAGVNEAGEILVIGRDELPDAGADTHTNHEFP